MSKDNKHLPLFGVGPVIVYGQVLITAIAIWLTYVFDVGFASFSILKVPFLVVGILLIIFGFYLDLSAKYKSKLFKNVEENKLITDGVYAYTRNPVYSGGFLICVGAIFIANNLLLFIVPVICWIYMTVFLIKTEEVWLKDLYGKEYIEYCKKVNRCIPWVPKKDRAKKIFSPLMAILSIVSPICIVGIMCMIETEIIEAVISGLALGCMVGSVFSIIFWVTNKDKNKILKIISLIPLVFVGLYALLFILYLAYK